ncbi:MAG TPA: tyrosine-type recombinase/integrase [Solirubrobacteraceae bacterium]|jgi:integrase|nr:tyrosine-type recombinase/integrase [Solirubrobacteraceae bacterium]
MADVERGTWRPSRTATPSEPTIPTFHAFAKEWWVLRESQWARKTRLDYRWKLEHHLLPYFGQCRLGEIRVADVERYAAAKLVEKPRPLSPRSVNATITLLGMILEAALDRDFIGRNPARGRGRKVRERAPRRTYLETAEQIASLLDAAGELDSSARADRRHVERRAILTALTFAGLRISELCALRWRDVDLDGGWLHVGESKTDAGRRRLKLRPALLEQLVGIYEHLSDPSTDSYVFQTRSGKRSSGDNIRSRVLKPAIVRANHNRRQHGQPPLPEGITPHSLRRTFASVLYALGEDPGIIMDEMGHSDPALALRIYRQSMRRDEGEKTKLRVLLDAKTPAQNAPARRRWGDPRFR